MDKLLQLTWQDLLTITSFAFGVVTLLAYLDQRRSASKMVTIAKWASLNLDKSMSEEQIRQLLTQKAAMEEQVERRIPALARSAILHEQRMLHEQALAEHYASWQAIRQELQANNVLPGLEPQLQQAILDRVIPAYMRRDRRDRFRTRVMVLSVALAVFATVLPSPLGKAFAILLAVPLLYAAARLYALNEGFARACSVLRPWFHFSYGASILALEASGLFLIVSPGEPSTIGSLGMVMIGSGLCLVVLYWWSRKWIDSVVEKICSSPTLTE